MRLYTEADLLEAVRKDKWMMEVLEAAFAIKLPDQWIAAGFVRAKVWDMLHNYSERTELPDVDVIYYDKICMLTEQEKHYERKLRALMPETAWSVKNQARMHKKNGLAPYQNAEHAMSMYPETATAVGLQLTESGELTLSAPYGVKDLFDGIVRPAPNFSSNPELYEIYKRRLQEKQWQKRWPNLRIVTKECFPHEQI